MSESITKHEAHYFNLPDIENERLLSSESEAAYSIVSLAFKDDNKWHLYDGNSTISVGILDEAFLRKVDQNIISFAKGDILRCKIRTTQWRTPQGLKTDYEVLEVIEHLSAARQLLLFNNSDINDNHL